MDYNKNNSNNDRNSYNFIIFTKKPRIFVRCRFCVSLDHNNEKTTQKTPLHSTPFQPKIKNSGQQQYCSQPARTSLHSHSRLATGFLDEVFKPLSSFCFVLFFRFSVSVSFHVFKIICLGFIPEEEAVSERCFKTDRQTNGQTDKCNNQPSNVRTDAHIEV